MKLLSLIVLNKQFMDIRGVKKLPAPYLISEINSDTNLITQIIYHEYLVI